MRKNIVLTSGTSGIGKAIALKLLREKNEEIDKLIINYGHDDHNAEKFYKSLDIEERKHVILLKADLSSYTSMDAFIEEIRKQIKNLDWLILNTGIGTYIPFEDYTPEEWDKVMRTNLGVPVFIVKSLKSIMKERGAVLFMGSYAGQEPYSSSLVYGTSKAAVLFLAKSLVKHLEYKKIRVNAVAPGFIETRWQKDRTEESRLRINRKIALHRFGTPDEVADLCHHILHNEYLNGSIFDIHGGYNYF